MFIHNLMNPQFARKQAQQRWLYSAVAFACFGLSLVHIVYVLQKKSAAPINLSINDTTEVSRTAPLAADPIQPVIKQSEHDICAHLTVPNYDIAAVIWQQEGEKLILRTPQGRHFALTLGQHLEQSDWKLQGIENNSIVWRDSRHSCRSEQAITAVNK